MKKRVIKITAVVLGITMSLIAVFVFIHLPEYYPPAQVNPNIVNDASNLNETEISRIIEVKESSDVSEGIRFAVENKLKISISGKKHTMGGHAFYPGAVLLDMSEYHRMDSLDIEEKLLFVQSGATWNDIQEYLNPHNLAVIAMQGPNIFTLGGFYKCKCSRVGQIL